ISSTVTSSTLENTILAGNTSAGASPDCSGTLISPGYILVGDASGCDISESLPLTDQIGGGSLPKIDPRIGPLADNRGATQTHALLQGSPAIDTGNPAAPGGDVSWFCPATDQRGVARPLGERCDIGAFESPFTAPPPPAGTRYVAPNGDDFDGEDTNDC